MQSTSATSKHAAARRKLAAVLSADVVGYFRLMIDATLETLTTNWQIMQDRITAQRFESCSSVLS